MYRLPRLPLAAGVLATALTLAAPPANAGPIWNLDFTGLITNSRDSGNVATGGELFGAATWGGQNGLVISGRVAIDSTAYADLNPSIYNGSYGPANGLFPQPADFFVAHYSIGGLEFNASEHMGPTSQHSIEFAAVQDIPPVNNIQQDIYHLSDGSQRLLCASADPLSCTGGALSTTQLILKLYGIFDFVGSDALVQPLDFDDAAIAAITGAPGGGQANSYLVYRSEQLASGAFRVIHDAAGEFVLTSMRLAPAAANPGGGGGGGAVPEPGSLALATLALGLALGWRRRAP